MNAIELKRELHSFIDQEDDKTVEMLYQLVQSYRIQKRKDKMIAEGEEDIKNGRCIALKKLKKLWINGNPNNCSINVKSPKRLAKSKRF